MNRFILPVLPVLLGLILLAGCPGGDAANKSPGGDAAPSDPATTAKTAEAPQPPASLAVLRGDPTKAGTYRADYASFEGTDPKGAILTLYDKDGGVICLAPYAVKDKLSASDLKKIEEGRPVIVTVNGKTENVQPESMAPVVTSIKVE